MSRKYTATKFACMNAKVQIFFPLISHPKNDSMDLKLTEM